MVLLIKDTSIQMEIENDQRKFRGKDYKDQKPRDFLR